jgi:hypothetical protein
LIEWIGIIGHPMARRVATSGNKLGINAPLLVHWDFSPVRQIHDVSLLTLFDDFFKSAARAFDTIIIIHHHRHSQFGPQQQFEGYIAGMKKEQIRPG